MSEHTILPFQKPSNVDFWIDETIWGHRLYDEQTPWLTFMEFLSVTEYYWQKNRAECLLEDLDQNGLSKMGYAPYHRLHLRNLLFNNPHLLLSLKKPHVDDSERWDGWLREMHNFSALKYGHQNGFTDIAKDEPVTAQNCEFYYLKERFNQFSHFAKVIEYLRQSALEMQSNKRWSSKFVFPFGVHCLYEDLNVKKTTVKSPAPGYEVTASSDRRFFARTGEILYLMLSRSGKGSEIAQALEDSIFKAQGPWDNLVRLLQPGTKSEMRVETLKTGAYLPYAFRPEYLCLAEDWLRLFKNQMPAYDVLPHLVNIAGLHLIRYFLNCAQETAGLATVECVLEIMAPRKTVIRDLASQTYYFNDALSQQALKARIAQLEKSEQWQKVLVEINSDQAANLLAEYFYLEKTDDSLPPEKQMEDFKEAVIKRHKQHLKKIHSTYAKEIGLASSRGGRRLRYTPTDEFLETLVLSTVPARMEYQVFLQTLYDKYRFVIGDQQAEQYIATNRADKQAFSSNAERLEDRLKSIGLLQRLSDACAYVINPYAGGAAE